MRDEYFAPRHVQRHRKYHHSEYLAGAQCRLPGYTPVKRPPAVAIQQAQSRATT